MLHAHSTIPSLLIASFTTAKLPLCSMLHAHSTIHSLLIASFTTAKLPLCFLRCSMRNAHSTIHSLLIASFTTAKRPCFLLERFEVRFIHCIRLLFYLTLLWLCTSWKGRHYLLHFVFTYF
jgi:hypothetical protein